MFYRLDYCRVLAQNDRALGFRTNTLPVTAFYQELSNSRSPSFCAALMNCSRRGLCIFNNFTCTFQERIFPT